MVSENEQKMTNSSLRKQLIITIIVLMLFVSSAIVWVFIQAGTDTVNNLTQRVMQNVIDRIGNDNEQHLNEAFRAIEAVAPDSAASKFSQYYATDLKTIEERLWFTSHLYRQTINEVYFAKPDGSFVGINRVDNDHVALYLRQPKDTFRRAYEIQYPGDRSHFLDSAEYDPRLRSWYRAAQGHDTPVWSDIYNNFPSNELTITLAKALFQPDHSLAGVVGTDITLKNLSEYLSSLPISPHSVAFIVDANGYIIASSDTTPSYDLVNNRPQRKLADEMSNKLIQQTYLNVVKSQLSSTSSPSTSSTSFNLDNEKIDVAYATLGNRFGLKWVTVVAVPRSDFMGGITHGLIQSIVIVVLFIILALITSLVIIEHMLRDIRQLTNAAQKIGSGEPLPRLHIHRKDEIGNLVQTFIEMENKLRIDRLTQVNNRDFLLAQIDFLEQHAKSNPSENVNFTLLFLDLDKFKAVNDSYGHAAGDQLLIVIAARLKAAVRDTDTVARFGGDEFVVLLNGTSSSIDIQMTVDKIHDLIEQPIALAEHIVSVRVSVGWAIFPTEALTYTRLVEIADARMFSSKKEHNDVLLRLVE